VIGKNNAEIQIAGMKNEDITTKITMLYTKITKKIFIVSIVFS
jgi:hypothetical protein